MFNPFQIYKKLARENLQLKEKIYNLEKTGDGQKQTEDELRLMHRQLITVLDNIDSVVYIADMQTYELLFINEYGRKVWGDIVGEKCWKTIQKDQDGPCLFCTNDKLLNENGKPSGVASWEYQNTINGRWYNCRDSAIQWTDGRIVRMEVAVDVTEQKQAEKELERINNIQSLILENSIFGIGFVRNRIFEWVNPRLPEMLGLSVEQVQGSSTRIIYPSEDVYNDIGKKAYDSLAKGEWFSFEIILRRADGTGFTVQIMGKAVNPSMPHEDSIWIFEDITERKRSEELVLKSEREKAIILDTMSEIVIYIDRDMKVVWANRAMYNAFGLTPETFDGDYCYQIHRRNSPCSFCPASKAMETGEAQVYDDLQSYGKRWILRGYPVRDENQNIIGAVEIVTDVTDVRKAIDAYRESEEKYRSLFETSSQGILIYDQDGIIQMCNPAMLELLGARHADELAGHSYLEFVYPDDREETKARIEEMLGSISSESGRSKKEHLAVLGREHRMLMISGDVVIVESTCAVFLHQGAVYIQGIFRNITERKKAEEELRDSQRRLADIIDFLPDAAFVIDREGYLIAWNKATENITGVKAENMIGKGNYEYAIPFYGERRPILIDLVLMPAGDVEKNYRNVKRQGDVLVGEAYIRNLKGKTVYLLGTASILYDAKGEVVGAIETIRDITERRNMEEALLAEGERLSSILDGTPVPAFVIDRNHNVILWNRSNEIYTGKAKNEMLGKRLDLRFLNKGKKVLSVAELMLEMADEEIIARYSGKGLRSSETLAGALEVISKIWLRDDERTMSIQAKRIYGPDGGIIGAIQTAQDITERIRLETQFRQMQKMEALGTLAGGIAHDFNNILGAIIGYTDLYKEQARDIPKVYKCMGQVLKAANRARDLVQQILTFSRMTTQEKRPVALVPIIQEAIKFIRATLPSTIEIIYRLNVSSDVIMADATQMHQVLMNLFTNAGQAVLKTGGRIDIYLEEVFIERDDLSQFSFLAGGRYLKLTVADTGYGIAAHNLEKIFEPYFTTKGKGEGTGLGLAVVHGIVRDHAGEIKVYSEPGRETVFNIYLPLIEKQSEIIIAGPEAEITGGNERILFVDDEETLADLGRLLLEKLGYKVNTETDPVKALEEFRRNSMMYDLLITDKTMPHMTGFKLIQEIRKIRNDIPVILCSGFQEKEDTDKLALLGISSFIAKPISMHILADAIRKILENK